MTGIAHAVFGWVIEIAARTRVHGGNEHEVGGELDGESGTTDTDQSFFKWLTHDFQNGPFVFGQLIEEKDTMVSQGDLPGLRHCTAANESDI